MRKRNVGTIALVSLCLVALSGCMTLPNPKNPTYSAGYVGDREAESLGEVMVSVVLRGCDQPYQNLHVALAAVINPRAATLGEVYAVCGIVRRSEPRVSANVVDAVLQLGALNVTALPDVKAKVAAVAQETLNETLAKWKQAKDYEVRVVVTSIYFTDGSVARPSLRRY